MPLPPFPVPHPVVRVALGARRRLQDLIDLTLPAEAALWDYVTGMQRTRLAGVLVTSGLADALPAGSTHNHPDGGMFVWARLPDGWDAGPLLERALDHDVAYVPGAPFFSGRPDPATLRLSFTAHPPHEIALGLSRLAQALSPSPATAAV